MANILSFSNWVKSHKTFLTEQVVTTYDSTYDYKKEGDVYYSKKKNTTKLKKYNDLSRIINLLKYLMYLNILKILLSIR